MYLADPTFGLDRYALTVLTLLSTKEPRFAVFNEQAQAYEVAVQTGLYLAADRRWASITMYPTFEARGLCKVVLFGLGPRGDEILVESWEPTALKGDGPRFEDDRHSTWRSFEQDISAAAKHIESELAVGYMAMRVARAQTRRLATPEEPHGHIP